jgi:hypothetical protein
MRGGLSSFPKDEIRLRRNEVSPMISRLNVKSSDQRASDYLGDNSTGGGDGDR